MSVNLCPTVLLLFAIVTLKFALMHDVINVDCCVALGTKLRLAGLKPGLVVDLSTVLALKIERI